MNLTIEKFSPTFAELHAMVENTKKIEVTDLKDPVQLKRAKEARKGLRDAEILVEKTGKTLRADAVTFSKAVIAKEKELKAITAPEITRLDKIEEDAEKLKIKEMRLKLLPARREKLESVKDGQDILSDNLILEMDDIGFEAYYNDKMGAKLEKQRIEQEDKQQKIDDANAKIQCDNLKIQREKDIAKAKKQGEKEAKEKLEAKQRADRVEIKKCKEDALRKIREDKAKLEADKKYKQFLSDNGVTKENRTDFIIRPSDSGNVVLYKKIAEFVK